MDAGAAVMLEAYDAQLREEAEVARAGTVVQHPPLLWATFGTSGMVTYRCLAGAEGGDLDALIAASIAYFAQSTAVRTAEWKTRGHDAPADLGARLTAQGFEAGEVETVMVGPAAALAADVDLPAGVAIRRVEVGPHLQDDVARAFAMQAAVFGRTGGLDPARVAEDLAGDPTHLQLWIAEAGDDVVAAGTLDVVRGTQFAGLWGGAVVAPWRGRGIYRALVAARARAALDLGVAYMHSDCTAMSRPILERSGLVPVTTTTPYVWTRPERGMPMSGE